MAEKTWFLHSQGVTFGPLPTKVVKIMIEQKRVTLTEFIWCPGMVRWERIRDKSEFGGETLPPYPDVDTPKDQADAAADDDEEEEAAAPKVHAAPPPQATAPKVKAIKAAAKSGSGKAAAAKAEVHEPSPAPAPKAQPQLKVVPTAPAPAPAPAAGGPEPHIRRSPRVYAKGRIVVEGQGNFEIADISETGVLVKSPKSMAPGTHLEFKLESEELEKSPLQMAGIVARSLFSQGKDCIAIEFIRVNPAYKRVLHNLVTSKAEKGEVVK